jgi:hypothetical protein
VAIPKELLEAQKNVTLSIDLFYVNQKHNFLMSYSESICFMTNTHVVSRKVKDYWPSLKDIYQKYLVRGLCIIKIKADLEFATLEAIVSELPTRPKLILAAQGEHVGSVERNIWYLKEKVRSLQYTLPYAKIPKFMLIHMVFVATRVMNMFPRRGGNKYFLPSMIVTGRGVTIESLRIAFGSYVQSTSINMPRNGLEPRTRGAIVLGGMDNETGGQVVMALDTCKLLRRSHVKVMTLMAEVIARVNYLGRDKTLVLSFQNKNGKNIEEQNPLNRKTEFLAIEDTFSVNSTDSTVLCKNGANLDDVTDVTGVEQPYKEYVDK